jgi:hypothetical protein
MDIANGEHKIVLVQLIDLHLALGHIAEQAIDHNSGSPDKLTG